jgi:hypothetical protein
MKAGMFQLISRGLALAVLTLGITGGATAQGTLLLPGHTVNVDSSLFGSGTLDGSGSSDFFGINGRIAGSFSWQVWSGDLHNTLSGLTFAYRFDNLDGADDSQIDRVTIKGFNSFTTKVAYNDSVGDIAPDTAHRSLSGRTIGFSFEDGVSAGNSSNWLIVFTNAPAFARSGPVRLYEDGADVATTSAAIPVPEPETFAMLIAGLGLLGFIARRRRNLLNPAA